MRKTKAVKVTRTASILLSVLLVFNILTMHITATSTPTATNEATLHLEEPAAHSELTEPAILQDTPQNGHTNRPVTNSITVPWEENIFYNYMEEWEYMILLGAGAKFHVCSDGYVWITSTERPICGSIFGQPDDEYADITSINELPPPSIHLWENDGPPAGIRNGTTLLNPEAVYYKTHDRQRNLSDYLHNSEYWLFRASGMTLEEFLSSDMARARNRAFNEIDSYDGILPEQFEAFYSLDLWQNMYEAVRALDIDLAEYEAMLARSGMTLSELVSSLMITGSTLEAIEVFLTHELLQNQEFHGVSFAWDGLNVYDEYLQESNAIEPFFIDFPTVTLTVNSLTHNTVSLTGRITHIPSGYRVTHHGFNLRRGGFISHFFYLPGAPSTFSRTITGLMPSSDYRVMAVAKSDTIHSQDWGYSVMQFFVTHSGPFISPPGPPQIVGVNTSTPGRATISWLPPVNDGGSAPFVYYVSVEGSVNQTVRTTDRSHVFNLPLGGQHTFSVVGINWANVGAEARVTATVTPLGGNPTPPTLELPVNTWNITAAANTDTFAVRANRAWVASSSNPTWLSVVNTASGSVTVTATAHTGTAQRTGTITISIPGTNVSLPINVTQFPPIRISLDANGGTVSPQVISIPQNPVGNALPLPVRSGYVFAGWSTSRTGSLLVQPNTMLANGTTLFARWYTTITLNPNGGSVNPVTITRMAGTPMPVLPDPEPAPNRRGYQFDGWFAIGNAPITSTSLVMNYHEDLTAEWSMIWYADYDTVSFWPGVINIYTRIVGRVDSDFHFMDWSEIASFEWAHALDRTAVIRPTTIEASAQIRLYGGTVEAFMEELSNMRAPDPDWAGWAEVPWGARNGTVTIDGITRSVTRLTGYSRAFVLEMSTSPVWGQTHNHAGYLFGVTIHELGHALGYLGHSPGRDDVMWYGVNNAPVLQPNEIRHLRQIYDRFR